MIDVSSLTDLQAVIALLIERSGSKGRRICELCKERKTNDKRSIVRGVSFLAQKGVIVRIDGGEIIRYYSATLTSPMGTPISPKTPSKLPPKKERNKQRKRN